MLTLSTNEEKCENAEKKFSLVFTCDLCGIYDIIKEVS